MRSVQTWLDEYGESHRNPVNKMIHWICVPLIMLSVIGLLWGIPRPAFFSALGPYANWATLVLLAAIVYYLMLSARLAAGMLVISFVLCVLAQMLQSLPWPLWATSLAIFVGAFVEVVSVPLIVMMFVAMFTVHLKYGFSSINTIGLTQDGPQFGPPGYEVNLLYIAGLLSLILGGAGALSIDRLLSRKGGLSEPPKERQHPD